LKTLYRATTSIQRPLFCGPKGGRCRQVWLYLLIERQIKHKNRSTRFSHNSAPSFTQNPKDPPPGVPTHVHLWSVSCPNI
jgi:hypothetical protein